MLHFYDFIFQNSTQMIKHNLLNTYLWQRKWHFGFVLFLGWLVSVCTFLIPISIGAFFDIHYQSVTNRSRLLKQLGIELHSLEQFFGFLLCIVVIKALLGFFEQNMIYLEAEKFIRKLTRKLFNCQIYWTPKTFNAKPYGRYLLRYSGDMNSIKNMIIKGYHGTIKDTLFLISGFGLLFWLHPLLSLIVMTAICLYFPFIYWLSRHQKPLIRRKRDQKSLLLSYVTECFSMHTEFFSSNSQQEPVQKFKRRSRKVFNANRNYQRSENLRLGLAPALGHLLVVLLFWQVTLLESNISAGTLLVYLLVLSAVVPPLRRLLRVPAIFQRGNLSIQKVDFILNQEDSQARAEQTDVPVVTHPTH
jgi:ABC-type bacteriocin/lantibiotic exporter with double-glycine peptidase domain